MVRVSEPTRPPVKAAYFVFRSKPDPLLIQEICNDIKSFSNIWIVRNPTLVGGCLGELEEISEATAVG